MRGSVGAGVELSSLYEAQTWGAVLAPPRSRLLRSNTPALIGHHQGASVVGGLQQAVDEPESIVASRAARLFAAVQQYGVGDGVRRRRCRGRWRRRGSSDACALTGVVRPDLSAQVVWVNLR
jgi:hypothetical protein